MVGLLLLAAVLVAAPLLFAGWLWVVRRMYRLEGDRPQRLTARCADGWELAVYERRATVRRCAEPVILAHGLSVTHLNLDFEPPYSVAHLLCEAGFDCYSVDWRGNGGSAKAPRGRRSTDYCVDDHIAQDAPAVLALALGRTGASRAFWVGHSLGGLVGYGLAGGQEGAKLAGIVTMGSPAFFVDPTLRMRGAVRLGTWLAWPRGLRQRLLSMALAPWFGWIRLPFSDSIINPRHVEPRLQRKLFANLFVSISWKILMQFDDWIRSNEFRSYDRSTDYRARMSEVRIPALVIAGSCDRLATPASVKAAYERLGSPDKTLVVFGTEHGDRMDYGHGDLVFGRGAPTEVYPVIARWLAQRATATQGVPSTSTSERTLER